MTPVQVLQKLPASLEWMVMFRLEAIRSVAPDAQIREMYFLPPELDLVPFSHVVLSSAGRFLAPSEGERLSLAFGSRLIPFAIPGPSLFDRHEIRLTTLPADEADCLGLGTKPPLPPVLLHLRLEDGWGQARALFQREPGRQHYELLKAVGVEYEGGEAHNGGFLARFRNRLPTHIEAGALGGFARTHHCNEFFLRHGEIDRELETGLLSAARDRVAAGRRRALAACAELARRACDSPMPMRCYPPPPEQPFPYGDLVPLGFLLRALPQNEQLRHKLLDCRQGPLWAFHTGRLVTATDSVLILQGLEEPQSVEALEQFSDGHGAYYPQLSAETPQPGRMWSVPANRHWRQPDFATTCLVRAVRARAGMTAVTPLALIEDWLDRRAGLYFANPYLVDWVTAEAIRTDGTLELKHRLISEILASRNNDHSFGDFDIALSTSFAILALQAAGYRGRPLLLAQLRLLDWRDAGGLWPESTPFYSTFAAPLQPGEPTSPQHLEMSDSIHELSLYRDEHRIIGTAAAALALSAESSEETAEPPVPAAPHPRYRCGGHAGYVRQFALPPYLGKSHAS
jgi:hypothetical protein